jgi:hypothetical protein
MVRSALRGERRSLKKGACKLCQSDTELVRSHLIPAALFDYLRADGLSPLRIGDGVVIPTDRQAQDYLLCSACEGVLNKGGESWVNTKLATTAQSFPLYDLLTSQPTTADDGKDAVYFTANNPRFNGAALTHFAIGIFWKASVHSWKKNEVEPMIELGPYEDELRRWLLGEIGFPGRVCLVVELARPSRALITLNPPFEKCREGWRTFFMHVLGASFTLEVGSRIDPEVKKFCFCQNSARPVLVSEELTSVTERLLAKHSKEQRQTRAYLLAKTKRGLPKKP